MGSSVREEKHATDRWQVGFKMLPRWRLDGEGPVWHKLFRRVRYHEADVLVFEHSSAQHLITPLGIKRGFKPEVPEAAQGLDPKSLCHPRRRINVLFPNRLSIRSTASKAVWLRRSRAGLSSITSRLPRRPVSAIISMHSCASR